MSARPITRSPPRPGALKRTVSFPGPGSGRDAEAGYGAVPNRDETAHENFTNATCVRVAGRLLIVIAVFGVLGSLLPFFAVGWAHKLGVPSMFVKNSGGTVSAGLQMVHAVPASLGRSRLGQALGDVNLVGTELKPCSGYDQASATGWHRDGSCAWSPDDGGYHEVCVTMASEFLASSATHDGNDLSSVVTHGERWCVCAWAWASAVQRDPVGLEGLALECEESNAKLREVYQAYIDKGEAMTGPTGETYGVEQALEAVNRLCPDGDAAASLGERGNAKRARTRANAHATLGVPY